jgi:CheY-like chemotaxis protein
MYLSEICLQQFVFFAKELDKNTTNHSFYQRENYKIVPMFYKNILQIDDDSDDCELFMEALEAVSSALYTGINNPVEALRKLAQNEIKPDVIFLDLNMPIMSGLEFLTQVKKLEIVKEIPIIIFSTLQLEDIIQETKGYGAFDCISKPNNFNELKKILAKYTQGA